MSYNFQLYVKGSRRTNLVWCKSYGKLKNTTAMMEPVLLEQALVRRNKENYMLRMPRKKEGRF